MPDQQLTKYLVKFTSTFMKEGEWSLSTIEASDVDYARAKFLARVAKDWGNGMVQHIGIISVEPYPGS